ncbi:unnamed protein product [Owenia fusiformis]|uniref:Uncharacterized protein n=1 Tax=Owenia fusiformis TaxID=6347 RepID=A0A8J1T7A3_OWEFU|nr:unnamed protein product [Owenia fusiformis]
MLKVVILLLACLANTYSITIPPLILEQPPQDVAFKIDESIELRCISSGSPQPQYKWLWNNEDFDASGNDGRVTQQPGVGTLIFSRPIKKDEGTYQCIAENQYGKSLSQKIVVRIAVLEKFPQRDNPVVYRPYVGSPLTLNCVPPVSYPPSEVFWSIVEPGERFRPIDTTNRVTMDHFGSLHFANVLQEDRQDGRKYVCTVQNKFMRAFVQGEDAIIEPQGDIVQNRGAKLEWASPFSINRLQGGTIRFMCLFTGMPTPNVEWDRLDGKVMPPRSRLESFGQELVLENVQIDDAGQYECSGENTGIPIRKSFDLVVEAKPYWRSPDTRPKNIQAGEGDKATYMCIADGIPAPQVFWFINGRPLSQLEANPYRLVNGGNMTFINLMKEDTQNIQCNATNKHGYIWADAYLNVLDEKPTIMETPGTVRVAESQDVQLRCKVFGAPRPVVVWKRGNMQLTGGRYTTLPDGHLNITDVSAVDAGIYSCTATNKFGSAHANGSLIVRRRTLIRTAPLDITVPVGTEAKFTCTATTDPEEIQNLKIDWKKDDQIIDYRTAQRVFKNIMDNSLTVSGTISLDTGKYTCMAHNGLDTDEASAQLVVQDIPDPPTSVTANCKREEGKAEVEWQPNKENYAPILNFIVQFNTTFSPDTWLNARENITQNQQKVIIDLSPYGNYSFRVLARNKIGMSNPSMHSKTICTTLPGRPRKNPDNVRGEGDASTNLVITWTPMPKIEQNALGFHYVVYWKRADDPDALEYNERIDQPERNYLRVDNQPVYVPYDIRVRSWNAEGSSEVEPTVVTGYSGEAEPLVAPQNFNYDESTLTATECTFTWDQVDTSPSQIRGYFRGYRIQYWAQKDGPQEMREEDIILIDTRWSDGRRKKRQLPSTVSYRVKHLPQYQEVIARVLVLNKRYAGPTSAELSFRTREGVPGPVSSFELLAVGQNHFDLKWGRPIQNNGILTGYQLAFQKIKGLNLDVLQERPPIMNASATEGRLNGLQASTDYRVYLWGITQKGRGEEYFMDLRTSDPGPPGAPSFVITNVTETAVNLTWVPSRSGIPGSVFYVQFRRQGKWEWQQSPDVYATRYHNLTNLDTGSYYEIRVIAKNGAGDETPSAIQEVWTKGTESVQSFISFLWLLIMLLVLLIFFILVGLVFYFHKKLPERQEEKTTLQIPERSQASSAYEEGGFRHPGYTQGPNDSESSIKKPAYDSEDEFESDEEYTDDEDELDTKAAYPTKEAPYPQYAARGPSMPETTRRQYTGAPEYARGPNEAAYAPRGASAPVPEYAPRGASAPVRPPAPRGPAPQQYNYGPGYEPGAGQPERTIRIGSDTQGDEKDNMSTFV